MNKFMKPLLITALVASNATAVFAAAPQTISAVEQRASTLATLSADQEVVEYSKFLENGGGELWVKLTLNGTPFNTNEFRIECETTNSTVPLIVSLPITR